MKAYESSTGMIWTEKDLKALFNLLVSEHALLSFNARKDAIAKIIADLKEITEDGC